jgi:fatty acid desaturase
MQEYLSFRIDKSKGRAIWQSVNDQVLSAKLATPILTGTLIKLGALSMASILVFWLAWFHPSFAVLCLAYLLLTLLMAQFAFIGHDAGHGAISRNLSINRALGQLCMTLVTGQAFDEWRTRHLAHHQFCQNEDKDPDMEVTFVASLTERSARQKGFWGRFMTRHQGLSIWALSLFFSLNQRYLSQWAVLKNLGRYKLDGFVLTAHFAFWIGAPHLLFDISISKTLLAYLLPPLLLGPYFAAIFWVNHIGMPLIDDMESFSFIEHQALTSRNISNPSALDWFFGGLNFQIEHHLFPRIPASRLSNVKSIVRSQFARHGIPYNEVTWWSAMRMVAGHFKTISQLPIQR